MSFYRTNLPNIFPPMCPIDFLQIKKSNKRLPICDNNFTKFTGEFNINIRYYHVSEIYQRRIEASSGGCPSHLNSSKFSSILPTSPTYPTPCLASCPLLILLPILFLVLRLVEIPFMIVDYILFHGFWIYVFNIQVWRDHFFHFGSKVEQERSHMAHLFPTCDGSCTGSKWRITSGSNCVSWYTDAYTNSFLTICPISAHHSRSYVIRNDRCLSPGWKPGS